MWMTQFLLGRMLHYWRGKSNLLESKKINVTISFFQLRDEGKIGDFLGIRIQKQKGGSLILTQTGLIEKVIKILRYGRL
jgi:hypothetical protein